MSTSSDVERIAHAALLACAPEEEPFFDRAVTEFRRDPARPPDRETGDRDLGFGVEVGAFVGGLLLWLTQEALTFAARSVGPSLQRATQPWRRRLADALRRLPLMGRFFPSAPATLPAEPLSPEQLRQIRELTVANAGRAGVEPAQAALLADAIVGQLALRP